MDMSEAARMLGVADTEIVDVRQQGQQWEALHHDMASHVERWRPIPGAVSAPPEVQPDESGEPVGDLDGDGVPDGTAAEVLEWVGDDRDRAGAALLAETARDKPRTTLVAALEKLTA